MTRASDTARLLGAGATILDGTTITTADNTTQLILTSTDADAAVGPVLEFNRNSASAADSDLLGRLSFIGKNDAGEDVDYGIIRYKIDDASDGTEDADIAIRRMVAGTSTNILNFKATETIFNEDGANIDFRVESDTNANMLFVDAGNDQVAIGHNSPSNTLDIRGSGLTVINIGSTGANGAALMLDGDSNGDASGGDFSFIKHETDGRLDIVQDSPSGTNEIRFYTEAVERFRLKNGEAVFNEASHDIDFRVESNGQSHLLFVDGGNDCFLINNSTRNNLGVVELLTTIGVDNAMIIKTPESGASGTATAIKFRYNGSTSGTISYTGSSTSYATSSDYRLKENVTYDFDATSRLKQLKPSRFNFIADKDTIVDGFLAHEVSNIVPEAITGDKDETENIDNVVLNANGTVNSSGISQSDWTAGKSDETYASDTTWVASKTVPKYQAIDQSKLVPLLVKTIQELEARITALENA